MRFIITGGTGLIGQALVADLASTQHEIYVLSRKSQKMPNLITWDGKTGMGWADLITDHTTIINLAGTGIADKRWSDERKTEIMESRVKAGQAIIDAIESSGKKPRVVIQASAVGYYGPRPDEVTENSASGSDFLAEVCRHWEASTAPLDKMGVRRAIIRTGVVLSTKGGALPRMLTPFKMFVGGPLGSGKQWFPWIHIKDQIKAIRYLVDNENAQGAYNLAAPTPLTNAQFSHALGRVMNRPAVLPAPSFIFKIIFGEMSTVLLDGQRAVPHRLLESGFEFQFPHVNDALKDLLAKQD